MTNNNLKLTKNQAELLLEMTCIADPITNIRWSGWNGRGQALRGLVARGLVEVRGQSELCWRPSWAQATDHALACTCCIAEGRATEATIYDDDNQNQKEEV